MTVFPERARGMLAAHLEEVKARHEEDLRLGRVTLPGALARRLPQAAREWAWQWVFPAGRQFAWRRNCEDTLQGDEPEAGSYLQLSSPRCASGGVARRRGRTDI